MPITTPHSQKNTIENVLVTGRGASESSFSEEETSLFGSPFNSYFLLWFIFWIGFIAVAINWIEFSTWKHKNSTRFPSLFVWFESGLTMNWPVRAFKVVVYGRDLLMSFNWLPIISVGFTMGFCIICWEIVKHDMRKAFQNFHEEEVLEKLRCYFHCSNSQQKSATELRDFRPISLIGSIYKIFSKVLIERLKRVIERLVDAPQMTFIKGRQIMDVILQQMKP